MSEVKVELSPEQLRKLLRGCEKCPLNSNFTVTNKSSIPWNPSLIARVCCGVVGDQWVRPTAAGHHDACKRRIHAVRKAMKE